MNKKFIVIIPIILIVSLVGISVFAYNYAINSKDETINNKITKNISKKTEDKKNVTNDDKTKPKEKKNEESNNITPIDEENNHNIDSSVETQKSVKNKTDYNQNNVISSPKTEEPEKNNSTNESGPWDAWGLSKDEYYNSPYPKDARIDIEASFCGSESSCLSVCAAKGDTYNGYMYSCDIIKSASGNFLGVMLDLEKVQ